MRGSCLSGLRTVWGEAPSPEPHNSACPRFCPDLLGSPSSARWGQRGFGVGGLEDPHDEEALVRFTEK